MESAAYKRATENIKRDLEKVAFSGSVNLADEYINHIEKHGHWKDIGIKRTGEAAGNYVRMFAEFWNAFTGEHIPDEYLTKKSFP